mgnify:CR=1 FL=1|jgi:predicted transcriptional regulator
MTTPKNTVITLRLDTETYNVVHAMAKKEEIPVSYVLRRALKKGLNLPVLAKEQDRLALPDWE